MPDSDRLKQRLSIDPPPGSTHEVIASTPDSDSLNSNRRSTPPPTFRIFNIRMIHRHSKGFLYSALAVCLEIPKGQKYSVNRDFLNEVCHTAV